MCESLEIVSTASICTAVSTSVVPSVSETGSPSTNSISLKSIKLSTSCAKDPLTKNNDNQRNNTIYLFIILYGLSCIISFSYDRNTGYETPGFLPTKHTHNLIQHQAEQTYRAPILTMGFSKRLIG